MRPSLERVLIKCIDRLVRWRLFVALGLLILTVAIWPIAARLQFDRSIESLYAEDDPHFTEWAASRRLFGGDEFAMIAWREAGLFEPDGLRISEASRQRMVEMAAQLAEVPGVYPESIQHLAAAADLEAVPAPIRVFLGEERRQVVEMVEGVLVGADHETTAIVVRLMPEKSAPVSRGETISRIRQLASAHEPPAFVVGEPVQIHDMFRYVEDDGRLLFLVSLGLLAFVLLVLFRSVRWVLLPLVIVVLTIRGTEALLVLADARLSMVSSMLNSLVTIIGVATATHIAVGFRDRRRTMPRDVALQSAVVELTPAIFWTCATTALGFFALLSSRINPVRSFGLMMTIATMLCFVVVIVLSPVAMSHWFNRRKAEDELPAAHSSSRIRDILFGDPVPAPAEQHLVSVLGSVSHFTERRPRFVFLATVTVLIVAGLGITRLRVETDFSRNFRESSDIVKSLNFVESRLGGAGSWEVNFAAPQPLTDEYLALVETLTERLRSELLIPGDQRTTPESAHGRLTKVASLTDALKLVPKEIGIGFFKKTLALSDRLDLLSTMQGELVTSLYNADEGRMRIVLRGLERQRSDSKLELISNVRRLANDVFAAADASGNSPDSSPEMKADEPPQTTGLFVLLTFLIESLMSDQLSSFVIAAVGIGLMMTIALRNVWFGLISLVPNLFPILVLIGFMGWLGVPINIATAMIASVSMGLTVDSSVHYLMAYQTARRKGATVSEALASTQAQVGKALVFANVALIAGFSVLTLSHFIPLVYFGILVSIAMLGGLAGNLFLLPPLIRWVDRSPDAG